MEPGLALALFMRNHHLGGAPFAPRYARLAKSRQVVDAIAADPLAIGFANLSHADPRVRAVALASGPRGPWHDGSAADIASGNYPLDRHLLIYAGRDDLPGVAGAFLDFALSCEGQAIVGQGHLGYRPLNVRLLAQERKALTRAQVQVGER